VRKVQTLTYPAYFAVDPDNNVVILCPANDSIPDSRRYALDFRNACMNAPYAKLQPVVPA
jgi:hypothetical protein